MTGGGGIDDFIGGPGFDECRSDGSDATLSCDLVAVP